MRRGEESSEEDGVEGKAGQGKEEGLTGCRRMVLSNGPEGPFVFDGESSG
jgi:hypothetical protein